ncbi:MAG: nucleotidyltransferase family protein, partial [Defluviitaleaceae bacterium]|nr:nucleotidyltransferase family protein [Defluviitaleaceae bacterium]
MTGICGIIAEYNPMHNGHIHHIKEARKLGARRVVAVISGNFVQRGEPAVLDKFARTRIALESGI